MLPDPILRQALKWQLRRAQKAGLTSMLREGAQKAHIPVEYALAIASRETGIRNLLGDGGQGIGVCQIDVRFHEIAKRAKLTGSWKTFPLPLIEYGCAMLGENIGWARRTFPDLDFQQCLKVAASAYNCGRSGARLGHEAEDSDLRTTGKDYGRDVLKRMKIFAELISA